ncbi:hypothetical protein SAMCCGM7_Ch2951 [Sinorhizobium americanum CCGM7]|nr:hypothetical protein SAMCCGM7_Ch2951 [Sinorhizobium americanum CCGM7]
MNRCTAATPWRSIDGMPSLMPVIVSRRSSLDKKIWTGP